MHFPIILLVVRFLSWIQASPIPDQVYDGITELCLSRRDMSDIFDYSEPGPEDSLFANSNVEPLRYEVSDLPQGSDLVNEGLESDLNFFSGDIAALPLDTALKDSNGQRKDACSAGSNSLPSSFKVLSPLPANPYIPSCELDYPTTLCCRGDAVPVPLGSANLGSQVLALPDLYNSDGLVHVGDCIICDCSHVAFGIQCQLTCRVSQLSGGDLSISHHYFLLQILSGRLLVLITDKAGVLKSATDNNMTTGQRRTPM